MAYLALARKWRPKAFAEVVGQDHVVQALSNALDSGRVHHAFLFTGTRGVGKTTLARIFAKSLNCEEGASAEPCQQCSTCVSIDEGRFVDLIEIDAASRTKVDDTRELLESVQYAPTSGKCKVYLIDEVHMLSGHSFNALLKTLEEPPEHVKFLFATTDPQKLPVTVLSRCLQFNLRAMRPEQVENQLVKILGNENLEFDQAALHALAKAADGSMRDGLSLLDQAIAQGAGAVRFNDVESMLGTIKTEHSEAILSALVTQEVDIVLSVIADMADNAVDFSVALDDVLMQLYHLSLAQLAPNALAATDANTDLINGLAEKLSPEAVQLYYQIGLIGKRDIALAPSLRVGFEMALLRMLAFEPVDDLTSKTAEGSKSRTAEGSISKTAEGSNSKTAEGSNSKVEGSYSKIAEGSYPKIAEGSYPKIAEGSNPKIAEGSNGAVEVSKDEVMGNSVTPAPHETSSMVQAVQVNIANDVTNVSEPRSPTVSQAVLQAAPQAEPQPSQPLPVPVPSPQTAQPSAIAVTLAGNNEWGELLEQTNLTGMAKELAMNCACERLSDDKISVTLSPKLKHLFKEGRLTNIQEGIRAVTNTGVLVTLDIEESERETPAECLERLGFEQFEQTKQNLHDDPGVKALMSEFGATINEESIKPV